ncbi:fused MFS/spermidine synthase [Luteimonas terrae]|uniref:fused MFS/spermidine synthase n=1 Tax=Luteimonas terrae TaxID=1530191 RepID=UPI001AA0A838|nr:fused MFS/spermidine synthase [Luteimonas terrae]
MTNDFRRQRHLLLAVFVLSGFAGLVYQSIWSHYIGLFLGHAAYAQALVLAIFMGGMAVGAALIAKAGERWRNLIRGYAVIEVVIGVLGLAFHWIYGGVVGLSYDVLIPAAGGGAAVNAVKWGMAALLILPQTVLLGMTFPLMSGGLIRRFPGQDGDALGGLYFTNSAGAAVGALATAFVLLPAVGLPGATVTAGVLNLVVAALAWWVARTPEPERMVAAPVPADAVTGPAASDRPLLRLVLWGTALSGAASFVYEIVWIRMLSMAVGSTLHAFELMLASFIAGIALGGLWIRKRADRTADPLRLVGWMQILMGLAALASLVLYGNAFEWVGWMMRALARSDGGYVLFNLGSATISMLIMLPAAFFAGTTLPLFTVALLRAGFGERSIGRVYAWNTMGAIFGVFAAIHLLIPGLGLKLALCVAALLDLAIGLVLLRWRVETRPAMLRFAAAGLLSAGCLALVVTQVPFDPMRLASGVFRTGNTQIDPSQKMMYYRDGKTASVSVVSSPNGTVRIATNGKVDASIAVADDVPAQLDEPTMAMLAALPLAMHEAPERVGVIGFGSGMTTHVLLGDSRVRRVDTVEIEQAMVEGARAFGNRVVRAYEDPRSNVVIDDAKVHFSGQSQGYDIIVSEPSNPWISGVGSLFSKEFYSFVPRQLNEGGLFVQWVQLYEIDDRLVASILSAMTPAFGDYAAWMSNHSDLIIVATMDERLPEADFAIVLEGAIGDDMRRVGISHPEQLAFRKVADARMLRALGRLYGSVENSDYRPLLSLEAPRTRFLGSNAVNLIELPFLDQPVLDMLGVRRPLSDAIELPENSLFQAEALTLRARRMQAALAQEDGEFVDLSTEDAALVLSYKHVVTQCAQGRVGSDARLARFVRIAAAVTPYIGSDSKGRSEITTASGRCADNDMDIARALVEATAARDADRMLQWGTAWFARGSAAHNAREHHWFDQIAYGAQMLAFGAKGDWRGVEGLEHELGAQVKSTDEFLRTRSLLLSMADDER